MPQVKEIERKNPFISIPDYDPEHRSRLISFFTNLIRMCLYEDIEESDWNSMGSGRTNSKLSVDLSKDEEDLCNKSPNIFVIDNAHDMCPTSWLLLESIMREAINNIVIILLINTDTRDRMLIHPNSVEVFEEVQMSI